VNFDAIPEAMRARAAWVVWKYEEREPGKQTKVLYRPDAPRVRASSTDPTTWAPFGVAVAVSQRTRDVNGIGYVLSPDDPFVAVDLDHCIDKDGTLEPKADEIVRELDSYTEITPSGEGLRIIARGALPPGGRKRGNVEMYDTARFVTMTGRVFAGRDTLHDRPAEVAAVHGRVFPPQEKPSRPAVSRPVSDMALSDQEVMTRALAARNGEAIRQLFHGDYMGAGYTSQSEADSALCYHLAFYTGGDPARVDNLFRDSGLFRDKWDEKHFGDGRTYGQATVERACANVSEVYQGTVAVSVVNVVNATENSKTQSSYSVNFKNGTGEGEQKAPKDKKRTWEPVDNADSVDSDAPARDWEPVVPLGVYRLPVFPVPALPLWLSDFVTAEAEQTQTPPDLAGMFALSACAAACAKRFEVQPKAGWREPLNLYTATVLSPGNRKSAVCSAVTRPLEEFERGERERVGPEVAQAQAEKRVLEARQRDAEKKAANAGAAYDYHALLQDAKDLAAQAAAVSERGEYRLFTEDCTPERLTGLLADNEGRMAILSAEGDTFDIISGRYSEKANMGVYLKSHNGETLIVDRVGRRGERVERPSLTIGMAVQPDVIRGLLAKPQLRGRGLLGRFLYSLPQDRLGFRDTNPAPMPFEIAEGYAQGMHYLLSLQASPNTENETGEALPHTLGLSDSSRVQFEAYERQIEADLRPGADMGDMTDWGGKLAGAVVRLAGILHLAEHAHPAREMTYEVSGDAMAGAVALGFYLTAHARATFAEMGADADLDNARNVLAWIARNNQPRFSQRDAYRALARRFKRSEDMAPALSLLCARNYLREIVPDAEGRKHNKGSEFDVNPVVFEMEARR